MVVRPTQRSESGRETHLKVRKWSETIPEVWNGRETLPEVRKWSEIIPDLWNWS